MHATRHDGLCVLIYARVSTDPRPHLHRPALPLPRLLHPELRQPALRALWRHCLASLLVLHEPAVLVVREMPCGRHGYGLERRVALARSGAAGVRYAAHVC